MAAAAQPLPARVGASDLHAGGDEEELSPPRHLVEGGASAAATRATPRRLAQVTTGVRIRERRRLAEASWRFFTADMSEEADLAPDLAPRPAALKLPVLLPETPAAQAAVSGILERARPSEPATARAAASSGPKSASRASCASARVVALTPAHFLPRLPPLPAGSLGRSGSGAAADCSPRSSAAIPSATPHSAAAAACRGRTDSSATNSNSSSSGRRAVRQEHRRDEIAGYTALRHNPPLLDELRPLERPRQVHLQSPRELLARAQSELQREAARGLLRPREALMQLSLAAAARGGGGGGNGGGAATAGDAAVLDLSTHYALLAHKAEACARTLEALVPLSADEARAMELEAHTKADLQRLHLLLHPIALITEATTIPEAIVGRLTATHRGVPVVAQHDGRTSRHAAPSGDIDCKYVATVAGTLDAHIHSDRAQLMAALRAKQRAAEVALGICSPSARLAPPPLITDAELRELAHGAVRSPELAEGLPSPAGDSGALEPAHIVIHAPAEDERTAPNPLAAANTPRDVAENDILHT